MAFLISDSTPLHQVLVSALSIAGLPFQNQAVVQAESALEQQYFLNAAALRFKRRKSGCWTWLMQKPFHLPMCLAELISDILDKKKIGSDIIQSATTALNDIPRVAAAEQPSYKFVAVMPRRIALPGPESRKRPFQMIESAGTTRQLPGKSFKDLSCSKGLLQLAGQSAKVSKEVDIEYRQLNPSLGSYRVLDPPIQSVFVPIHLTIRLIAESLTSSRSLKPTEMSVLPQMIVQIGQRCRSKKNVDRLRVTKSSRNSTTSSSSSRTWDHVVCCSVQDVVSAFKYAFFEAKFDIPDVSIFLNSLDASVAGQRSARSAQSAAFEPNKENRDLSGFWPTASESNISTVLAPSSAASPDQGNVAGVAHPNLPSCQLAPGGPQQEMGSVDAATKRNDIASKPFPSGPDCGWNAESAGFGSDTDTDEYDQGSVAAPRSISPSSEPCGNRLDSRCASVQSAARL